MRSAARELFDIHTEQDAPYLFRSLGHRFAAWCGDGAGERVLEWERRLIEAEVIRAMGWRAVAQRT